MIKVLIVEDELLARLALKTAIDWNGNGFEVVAEAEDGLTGFQHVQKYRPHIVLTDISMPGMNGVELVKRTKECCPDTEILILSCHKDFEYVKEGLRAGAANYILKLSMSMEELLEELLQLKVKILKKNASVEHAIHIPGKEQWPKLLFSLTAKEGLSDLQVLEEGRRCGLLRDGNYAMVSVISIDEKEEEIIQYHENIMMEHLSEAVLARYQIGTYISIAHNRGVILCQMDNMSEYEEKTEILKTMLEELIGLIHDCYGCWTSAGISKAFSIRQLNACYRQAYQALLQKFYTGPGKIHQSCMGEAREDVPKDCYKRILRVIATHDINAIREDVIRWLDAVGECRYPEVSIVRQNIHELIFQIDSAVLCAGGGKISSKLVEQTYHKIQKQLYLVDMRSTLQEFFESAQDCCEEGQSSKPEIILAKRYVGLNYQSNIKLSDVAEHVGMNVDYFSHLFKKETGSAFSAYLNTFRIERAKQLLKSDQYKVYEVAYMIGFQEENYFIRCFKKQTGYTPLEYTKL